MMDRLLALAVLAASGVYLANAWPLPMGTAARPGAGFFPLGVGAFGAGVALIWVVSALRRRAPAGPSGLTTLGEGGGRVAVAAALLVAFCLGLGWTGYSLAAFLFTGLLLRGLGAKWKGAAVIALVTAAGSYYFFGVLLGVPLPRGVFLD